MFSIVVAVFVTCISLLASQRFWIKSFLFLMLTQIDTLSSTILLWIYNKNFYLFVYMYQVPKHMLVVDGIFNVVIATMGLIVIALTFKARRKY